MQQAQKMLPDLMSNPTADGGAKILNNMGVDKKFINEMYNKYGGFATKVPGLNKGMVGNAINAIGRAMGNSETKPQKQKVSNFDSKKYPKV